MKRLFTSESVTEGHPDKICDQISDSVLDALLKADPMARVACETCCTTGLVLVMGEITTSAYVDIQTIVREKIREAIAVKIQPDRIDELDKKKLQDILIEYFC